MTLIDWQQRWNIPAQAMQELIATAMPTLSPSDHSESHVQAAVRLEGARKGVHLFRNNVGAGMVLPPEHVCEQCKSVGQWVRWGLANDSKRINDTVKSADLIGFRPILITAQLVGQTLAQFVSRECKRGNWKWTGTKEDEAQLTWANLVNASGGNAMIVNSEGSF